MSNNKKQSFVQGAFILVVAALLVKFIGFFFKIPLTFLIKDDGMGLFNSAYQIYTIMFIVATAGFPTAISKMVAESLALNRRQEADRVFKVAICILAIIGIAGSLFLFFGAEGIAAWIKNTRSLMAIRAIAPAVLCVSFMAVFRGYFQGRQNMYPTAISEVTEAMGKLIFGYLFAWMFQQSVVKASAGAVFGVTMGTVLGFFSLFGMYLLYKKKREPYMPGEVTDSYRSITKKLIRIAVPITIGASVSSLTNLADMFTVMRRLQDITQLTPEFMEKYGAVIENIKNFDGVSMNEQLANSLYGMYTGKALTLFNFPLTMVVALGMSVVPVIAGTLAKKDTLGAQRAVNTVLKLTILFAIPCAIGMYVLASPILQAYGRTVIPVINMIIGGIIKVVINYNLVAVPEINIEGAPIGTMVCYCTVMLLNMIWIVKETKCKFNLMEYVVKPVFAGGVMGVVVHFLYVGVSGFGTVAALGVCVIAAVFVYFATLLVVRAFKEDDIRMLPKGEKILKLFRKFHLI